MKIKQMFKQVVAGMLTAATMLTSLSLPTFADLDDNGGGTGEGYGFVGNRPGFSDSYWGYRIAVVDFTTGAVQQDNYDEYLVVDLVQVDSTYATTMNGAVQNNYVRTDPSTNLGKVTRYYKKDWYPGLPAPVTGAGSWVGQGEELKDWLTSKNHTLKDGTIISNAQHVIGELFGDDVLEKVNHQQYKVVIEPIYLLPMYTDYLSARVDFPGVSTTYHRSSIDGTYSCYSGKYYYGTYAGSLDALYNLRNTTSGAIAGSGGWQLPVVRVTALCMYLEDDELGLTAPTGLTEADVKDLRSNKDNTGGSLEKMWFYSVI